MKKITIFFAIIFPSYLFSQNFIMMKSNKKIEIDSIFKIGITNLEYIYRSNVHDAYIPNIKYIRVPNIIITFDEKNVPEFDTLFKNTYDENNQKLKVKSFKTNLLEVFFDSVPNVPVLDDSLYKMGEQNADSNYEGYKEAVYAAFCSPFLLGPVCGLIPAGAIATTPPSKKNLGTPRLDLLNNSSYYKGYSDRAFKIKTNKVWTNYAYASAIYLAAVVYLIGSIK